MKCKNNMKTTNPAVRGAFKNNMLTIIHAEAPLFSNKRISNRNNNKKRTHITL